MQLVVSAADTTDTATIEKSMEKTRQIPPNAAPRNSVNDAVKRAEALGLDIHEVVKKAGFQRNLGYKLLRGEASVGSLRRIEEVLVKEEAKRGPKKSDAAPIEDWTAIGVDLLALAPERFEQIRDGLRQIVAAEKTTKDVLARIFRPTPGFGK